MPAGRGARDRLDRVVVARGLAATRAKAQALILAGQISSAGRRLDKPGLLIAADVALELAPGRRWVGRGGAKLDPVLELFAIPVRDRDALDVGASTGGFTQALLERGARRVIALDVGRGQLDWSLRNEPRVHVLEGLNARHLTADLLPFAPGLAVVDVSFISLELVLPPVVSCLSAEGEVVPLIKPQFEVGRRQVGRGGIVRDPALHREVLERFLAAAAARGWGAQSLCASPLRGAQGNREFFAHLRPGGRPADGDRLLADLERSLGVGDESSA